MEVMTSQELLRQHLTDSVIETTLRGNRRVVKKVKKKGYKSYNCQKCKEEFKSKKHLAAHILTHNNDAHECDTCHKTFESRRKLTQHLRNAHKPPSDFQHQCSFCEKSFRDTEKKKIHEMVHTGEKPHKCDVCGKAFRALYSYKCHVLIHTDSRPYRCAFCEYSCRDNSTLRRHQQRHLGIVPVYACAKCDRTFKEKGALKAHVAQVHLFLDDYKVSCHICNKTFSYKATLRQHIKQVHERAHATNCPVCNVYIPNRSNLKTHMTTHSDDKPYECETKDCGKRFKTKYDLQKHARIHDPTYYFECNECGYRFTRKNHLVKHLQKMHVKKVRKSKCLECGKRFFNERYLSSHMKRVHVTSRYQCDHCTFVTRNKPAMIWHLKAHDNKDDKTCKICNNKYKEYVYLKAHYLKTHNIRYKMSNRRKQLKPLVEIKEEPIDEFDEMATETQTVQQALDNAEVIEAPHLVERINQAQSMSEGDDISLQSVTKLSIDNDSVCEGDNDITQSETEVPVLDDTNEPKTEEESNMCEIEIDMSVNQFEEDTTMCQSEIDVSVNKSKCEKDGNVGESETGIDNSESKCEGDGNSKSERKITNEEISVLNKKMIEELCLKRTETSERVLRSERKILPQLLTKPETRTSEIKKNIESQESKKERRLKKKKETEEQNERNKKEMELFRSEYNERLIEIASRKECKDKEQNQEDNTPTILLEDTDDIEKQNNEEATEDINTDNGNVQDIDNDMRKSLKMTSKSVKRNGETLTQVKFNMLQCYVCFKLFPSRAELLDHCKIHFDICSDKILKKCPYCDFAGGNILRQHVKTNHGIKLVTKEGTYIEENGKFYVKVKTVKRITNKYKGNVDVKRIEIIPSVKNLNRREMLKIDRKRREMKLSKTVNNKLVKKGNEWIVLNEDINLDYRKYLLPVVETNYTDIEKVLTHVEKLKRLKVQAENEGRKILYPCNVCDRVCRNVAALIAHVKMHEGKKLGKRKDVKNPIMRAKLAKRGIVLSEDEDDDIVLADLKSKLEKQRKSYGSNIDGELLRFFEDNVKGDDVDFEQFSQIFKAINTVNKDDFNLLVKNEHFGIAEEGNVERNAVVDDVDKNKCVVKKLVKKVKKPCKNAKKYVRVVRLSRKEIERRNDIKNRLRIKYASQ